MGVYIKNDLVEKIEENKYVLLIGCFDRKNIINDITNFITNKNGNITKMEQHVDLASSKFYMRVVFELENGDFELKLLRREFSKVSENLSASWEIHPLKNNPRLAIFVSKESHCLFDLLSRHYSGELKVDIPVIISNHNDLEGLARRFGVMFNHVPVNDKLKEEVAKEHLKLLKYHKVDVIVLAKYMQIIPKILINEFENSIMNIHHSFLPAFVGAKPYHAAHDRGVKIIGATSHYVTEELDAGPIIYQDVERISHRENIKEIIEIGRDVESLVLAKALKKHVERKIFVDKNKTIVYT